MGAGSIHNITVVGAGDMGHGIAEVALMAGYHVVLNDVNQEAIDKGAARIDQSLAKLVSKGKVTQELHAHINAELLTADPNLESAVTNADLVIEAIPEVLDLKRACFQTIDKTAPAHALLASNTSTMSISQIAQATRRPGQVLGLHYFNPAVLMKLVEVIRGDATQDDAIDAAFAFCQSCGKVPVRVRKDVPGFIVNRVQAPGGVLMSCIADEGRIDIEGIDAVMRNLGMPMGPFELFDYTGMDINVNAMKYFAETVHPDFAPGTTLQQLAAGGKLGKKSGQGFFDWSNGRPAIDLSKTADGFDPFDIVAVNANEAAKLIDQDVCSKEDVDTAVTNGTGSAVGPMTLIRDVDPAALCDRLDRLADRYGKAVFEPAPWIRAGHYR